jgi:hypothetical protein
LTTKPTKPIITNPTPTYFRILKYSEKHVTHHTSRITQRGGRVVPSAGGACALVIQREASCTSHVTRHTSHVTRHTSLKHQVQYKRGLGRLQTACAQLGGG